LRGGATVVVADGFGGRLALVDPERPAVVALRTIPGHNIRGLAASPDGRFLVVAHQGLERSAPTTLDDVHFGALMRNELLVLPVEDVLRTGTDQELLKHCRVADLDGFGNGAGDPAGLAFDRDGGVAVALAGVGEVGLSGSPTGQLRRVGVGRRPSAVAPSPDGKAVFVADTADDAVWVIDLSAGRHRRSISLGPRPEPDAVERGERLFHDAKLAHDRWLSCQSCHTDGQTNGLLADTLGDGSYGAPKLVLPLLGVAATGPWAWDGSVDRLEVQVRKSIETTMQGTPPTDAQVSDLSAYLRSLGPPRVFDAAVEGASEERGREAFRARKCDACHASPAYTTSGRYDVGLTDEVGNRKFNPPSLRGVGARAPLFHDGSAETLEDVLLRFRHPKGAAMTPGEAADLIAFLKSL
jgi:cytochrome c peroxidase